MCQVRLNKGNVTQAALGDFPGGSLRVNLPWDSLDGHVAASQHFRGRGAPARC